MSDIKKQVVYAVHMKKRTAKEKDRYFIATDKKVDMGPGLFHGRGYWTEELPKRAADGPTMVSVVQESLKDVWIPWGNIDHVENLTYIGR
jgi:hypothetical protein